MSVGEILLSGVEHFWVPPERLPFPTCKLHALYFISLSLNAMKTINGPYLTFLLSLWGGPLVGLKELNIKK